MSPQTYYEKYLKKKSAKKLKQDALKLAREAARMRDEDKPCVTCGQYKALQGGHFIPVGGNSGSTTICCDLDNIHGQCMACNYYGHGNQQRFREEIIRRIGEDRIKDLEFKAAYERQHGCERNKFDWIDIILKLKYNSSIEEIKV